MGLQNWKNEFSRCRKLHPVKPIIWIHAASLGEFEQGRTIIDALHKKQYFVILTFNSPSGYEIRKNYQYAHCVLYLPLDTRRKSQDFIQTISPNMAIFIKYEFWWNYLKTLQTRGIHTIFISTVFRNDQYFFNPLFASLKKIAKGVNLYFVQGIKSYNIAKQEGLKSVVSGDTRLDNVISRTVTVNELSFMKEIISSSKPIIVYGSIWNEDISILRDFLNNNQRYIHILVPHETSPKYVEQISKQLSVNYKLHSQGFEKFTENEILIIDKIGILFDLYQYADLAFIGGGFGKGIHNILEPLAFNLPVIFGPNHKKFNEARSAIEGQFGYMINTPIEIDSIINDISQRKKKIEDSIKAWKKQNQGATSDILNYIDKYFDKS